MKTYKADDVILVCLVTGTLEKSEEIGNHSTESNLECMGLCQDNPDCDMYQSSRQLKSCRLFKLTEDSYPTDFPKNAYQMGKILKVNGH